jgi:ribosomal-protein-serine acetyltransferase
MLRWAIREDVELRLPEERYADEMLAAVNRNRERLEQWLHWAHSTHTREDVLAFVQMARRDFQKPDALHLLIFRKGKIAGGCGLILNERSNLGEIGYWIDAGLEGKGIVSDCCRALIGHAFRELNLNRVQIRCAPGNGRSGAVAKRLGLTYEGTRRQTLRTNDRLDDEECYGLLRAEWTGDTQIY